MQHSVKKKLGFQNNEHEGYIKHLRLPIILYGHEQSAEHIVFETLCLA